MKVTLIGSGDMGAALAKQISKAGHTLVITGSETDVCVLAAVLDAVDRGYRVVVAVDALCSVSDEAHDSLLALFGKRFGQQIEVAGSKEILAAWD